MSDPTGRSVVTVVRIKAEYLSELDTEFILAGSNMSKRVSLRMYQFFLILNIIMEIFKYDHSKYCPIHVSVSTRADV